MQMELFRMANESTLQTIRSTGKTFNYPFDFTVKWCSDFDKHLIADWKTLYFYTVTRTSSVKHIVVCVQLNSMGTTQKQKQLAIMTDKQ